MERSELKSKVEKLQKTISEATKELEEIRKGCKHPEHKIAMYEENGHKEMRKICVDCGAAVGYVSDADLKEILEKDKE